jgi:mRNA interferase MazF
MAYAPRQTKKQVSFPKRGEIYLVSFDPTVGHEIQKTRPALIIQNDVSNQYSPLTIVAAITSQFGTPPHPREVILEPGGNGLSKPSAVVLNQIRSIDKRRVIKRLGAIDAAAMKRVDAAIQISLGLIEL